MVEAHGGTLSRLDYERMFTAQCSCIVDQHGARNNRDGTPFVQL